MSVRIRFLLRNYSFQWFSPTTGRGYTFVVGKKFDPIYEVDDWDAPILLGKTRNGCCGSRRVERFFDIAGDDEVNPVSPPPKRYGEG